MRQPLPLAAALLIGGLACNAAEAQSWVDPPARVPGEAAPKIVKEAPPVAAAPAAPALPDGPAQTAATPVAPEPALVPAPLPDPTVAAAPAAPALPAPRQSPAPAIRVVEPAARERLPERRHSEAPAQPRRAAEAPAPIPVPTAKPAPVAPPAPPLHAVIRPPAASPLVSWFRMKRWAAKSHAFVSDYLDLVSTPGDTMVTAVPMIYAENVVFHGRTLSLRAVMADKRRFARRWPVRHYEMQARQTQAACSVGLAVCQVRTVFDFRAENPASGARSQGVSELVLDVSFAGDRPVIVSETSRVLRRSGSVSGLVTPRQGA